LENLIVEKANIGDAIKIYDLINRYAKEGQMLPKTLAYIYEHLRQYTVARIDSETIGVGALRIFWSDLAEVCSLAVDEKYLRKGIGRKIVESLEQEAINLGLRQVFALTYQAGFFVSLDYQLIDRSQLPQKIWQDCLKCPKYENCDEQAVIKIL
jgi:amino-acid N-acetyltransferase